MAGAQAANSENNRPTGSAKPRPLVRQASDCFDPAQLLARPLRVLEVEGAIVPHLTPRQEPEGSSFAGGVYDRAATFIPISGMQRSCTEVIGAYAADMVAEMAHSEKARAGVFCGPLISHFGHFLTEGMARLWWGVKEGFDGHFVFQAQPNHKIPAFAQQIFELLGIADRVVVVRRPIRFDWLVVPEAAFSIQSTAHRDFLIPFVKLREVVAGRGPLGAAERLYLSRNRMDKGRSVGEETVEAVMIRNGFTVAHPERMQLEEQIRLVLGAQSVAGLTGSAMHLLLFHKDIKATYILRRTGINLNYPMIDLLTGIEGRYVSAARADTVRLGLAGYGITTPTFLEPDLFLGGLAKAGFDCGGVRPNPRRLAEREYLRLYHRSQAELLREHGDALGALREELLAYAVDPDSPSLRARVVAALEENGYGAAAAAIIARGGKIGSPAPTHDSC